MGKQEKRRVVLSDYKAKAQDRYLEIEGEDGQVYRATPPELWPDEVFHMVAKEDLIGAAEVLMGAESYAKFTTTGGGSAALLFAILKEQEGIGAGE